MVIECYAHTHTHTHTILPGSLTVIAGQSDVDVKTKVRTKDSADLESVSSALGSGDAFKNKVDSAFEAQGLEKAIGATAQGNSIAHSVSERNAADNGRRDGHSARRLLTHTQRRGTIKLLNDKQNEQVDRLAFNSHATVAVAALAGGGSAHVTHVLHNAHKEAAARSHVQMLLELVSRAKSLTWGHENEHQDIEKSLDHIVMDKVKEEVPLKGGVFALQLKAEEDADLRKKTESKRADIIDFVTRNYVVCISIRACFHTCILVYIHACILAYDIRAHASYMHASIRIYIYGWMRVQEPYANMQPLPRSRAENGIDMLKALGKLHIDPFGSTVTQAEEVCVCVCARA